MQSVLDALHIHNYIIGPTAFVSFVQVFDYEKVLNAMLLWSLTTYNAVGWQSVRVLLALNAAIDALLALVETFTHVAMIIHSGFMLAICTGPLTFLGPIISEIGIYVFYDLVFVSYLIVPATLVYRYVIIDHNTNRNPKMWFRGVLLGILCIAFPIIATFPGVRVTPEGREVLLSVVRNRTDGIFDAYPLIGAEAFTPRLLVLQVCIAFELTVAYSVIVLFSLKTRSYIREQARYMTNETKELQKSLTLALMLQAISPIFTGLIPSSVIQMAIMTRFQLHPVVALAAAALHAWIPLTNAIIALAFYRPYRDHIVKKFRSCMPKRFQSSVTDAQVVSSIPRTI